MTHVLWRGSWATRIRIASGLILMIYVALHLLNLASVLISPDFFDAFQRVRLWIVRSDAGTLIMGLALFAHMALSLGKVALARTLRMPLRDVVQIVLGLIIPLILVSHVIYTRAAHEVLGVTTMLGYVNALIWTTWDGWMQALLVIITWVHGCIGLHMWLRVTRWWQAVLPWLTGIAVLVPTLAILGFVLSARVMDGLLQDARAAQLARDVWQWPDADGFARLAEIDRMSTWFVWALLAFAVLIFGVRRIVAAMRKPIRIQYIDGPAVRAPRGQTLLETSRANGVAHTALCGGRGRCTTCRVIVEEGLDDLPPPSEAERRTLAAVGAPPGARLACQMRPNGPVSVFRVFAPDGKRSRAHASQGKEAQLAVLFLDMRGFTARTDGQLPYDVVFLLNRFFDEIVPPILKAGGTVDKYMGDGLMAVFETDTPETSARAAITAVEGIGHALERFNKTLADEGAAPVAIGIGVHLGNVVLGEIGAAGQAPRTLIGDTVNTASRLEGGTKELQVQALISQDTLQAAGHVLPEEDMIPLSLRGRDSPLPSLPVKEARQLRDVLASLGQVVPA
ncbi:adenylate/guanylate cyclase domain-containing protein [uncultured Tateyamaria sp.]|uniref:adenylate/guanylate cyclase domain-containing protein n=1 Tax=uncultured Tateyamaria sp. TaxID=455651 RepID=UPI0026382A64|nr:adenylate/guanylate cyclase domain-containing protein [uncultured Tateyamaria sp.]